jgi:D-beta-D-heptose 7-phosphate kinase/D-beta-D-heptose 1-phosphate adenosyltransferase
MKVVLTNGCFDILHAGHVDLLWKAKALGDWLIVAINTDKSVRALKGSGRPINPYPNRRLVLAALKMVDMILPLDDLDMVEMLRNVSPQVWVKGGDYTLKTLNQKEVRAAREVKAEIHIIPVTYDVSTTEIIKRVHAA